MGYYIIFCLNGIIHTHTHTHITLLTASNTRNAYVFMLAEYTSRNHLHIMETIFSQNQVYKVHTLIDRVKEPSETINIANHETLLIEHTCHLIVRMLSVNTILIGYTKRFAPKDHLTKV